VALSEYIVNRQFSGLYPNHLLYSARRSGLWGGHQFDPDYSRECSPLLAVALDTSWRPPMLKMERFDG
jgi:hypothetical protein